MGHGKKQIRESLERLTRVNFPNSIVPGEVRDLLEYVSQNLGCDVRYKEEVNHAIHPDVHNTNHNKETTKIEGQITQPNPLVMLSFSLERVILDMRSRYSGLTFFTTPGYRLEELHPSEPDLMRKVGSSVAAYFESNRVEKREEDDEE